MKLYNRNEYGYSKNEYRCELTKELDVLSKISERDYYELFYHYVLVDKWVKEDKCLAIRVPGGTIGGIWIDDNNIITKILIDTDYVVKTYPNDINEIVKKFVGEVIEL